MSHLSLPSCPPLYDTINYGSLQADIQEKQKAIVQHHDDLLALYMDLAKSVSLIEENVSLGYARSEYEQYRETEQKWEEAKESFEQVRVYIQQMEDRSRKVKEIASDIKALAQPKRNVHAQIGAIAYEAYGSESLPEYIEEVCQPFLRNTRIRPGSLRSVLIATAGNWVDISCIFVSMQQEGKWLDCFPRLDRLW